MPWIQNIAATDVINGHHDNPGANSMLIQIMDTATSWWPEPEHQFREVHRFEFLDVEADDSVYDEGCRFSQDQADRMVALLRQALECDQNVLVHCFAGVSRSGAVTEIGVGMGFEDQGGYRAPNQLVLDRMRLAYPKYLLTTVHSAII